MRVELQECHINGKNSAFPVSKDPVLVPQTQCELSNEICDNNPECSSENEIENEPDIEPSDVTVPIVSLQQKNAREPRPKDNVKL